MSTYNHDNHDCRERVILEEYEKLSPDLIFEIIRHDGEEELERKTKPLILSGLAAGIIISFSFYFKAILAEFDEAVPPLGDCPFGEFCGHLYRRPLSLVAGFCPAWDNGSAL